MARSYRRRYRNLSLVTGLGGLVVLMLALSEYGDSGKIGVSSADDLQTLRRFDSYLLEPRGTTYGEDGKVSYHWQADRANRLNNGEVLLHVPIYLGLKDGEQSWTATALRGSLAADGQRLDLEQEVLIKDFIHNAQITTPELTLDIHNNMLLTTAPVRLTTPNATTRATGMRAAMNAERVEFLADVRGVYEKP